MTNPFIIPSLANLNADLAQRHFPLARGEELQQTFAQLFSRHLGRLRSGKGFEARSLLVTGLSGSGKTAEISDMLDRFNKSAVPMPDGKQVRFASCVLEAKGSWKDLGRKTLHALGYPITNKTRRTQFEIWDLVIKQAKLQGVIGIYYDEAQHIMRGKSDAEVLSVLDAFKTLMKSHDWPLMLILSGVPELGDYVQREPQLDRLMTRIEFQEIDLSSAPGHPAQDYETLNEIVGSYAISAGLNVDAGLPTGDFLHRLATAGAFRWGLVIDLVVDAVALAVAKREGVIERSDFVAAWCEKTGMNQLATPFTHDSYERMFRRDKPFRAAIGT
ncbi:ATP-binding protein [Salipiger sp. PrR003]|uniref:ATP-binding protein n=1 Tax=Salipiger sp. PrR003 TaxID=2706776 RepID=UPI0013DD21BA|nr:ATP-binding protein [Salipiger sp. PrR003]